MEDQEFLKYVAENVKWMLEGKNPQDLSEEFKQRVNDLTVEQHKSFVFTTFIAWNLGDDFLKTSKEKIPFLRSVFEEGFSLALFYKSLIEDEDLNKCAEHNIIT